MMQPGVFTNLGNYAVASDFRIEAVCTFLAICFYAAVESENNIIIFI